MTNASAKQGTLARVVTSASPALRVLMEFAVRRLVVDFVKFARLGQDSVLPFPLGNRRLTLPLATIVLMALSVPGSAMVAGPGPANRVQVTMVQTVFLGTVCKRRAATLGFVAVKSVGACAARAVAVTVRGTCNAIALPSAQMVAIRGRGCAIPCEGRAVSVH